MQSNYESYSFNRILLYYKYRFLDIEHDNVYRNEIVYCELEKFVDSILSPNLVIYAIVSMMDFKCEILKKIN